MTRPWRRRVDSAVLRWQARLDTDSYDRVLPWAVALVTFALLVSLALAQSRSLANGVDLGIYTQGAFLITTNGDPTITLQDGTHILAQQAAFIFYPIAWLTSFLPTVPTLLVVQSAALGLGAVPLWRIARRLANLRVGATAALGWAYALYPAVQNLNLADFHPETLAVPALAWAVLFGLSGRWVAFGIAAAATVAARADLAVAISGLGLVLALGGRHRPGWIIGVAGFAYACLAVAVIQPSFGAGGYAHIDSFASYGDTPLGVAAGMLTNPGQVLRDLTVEESFSVLVFLLAPVFFLPVLAPRYLIPLLPLEVLYLVADVPSEARFAEQAVAAIVFVFVASAFALQKIGREGVERVRVDRRVLGALLLASTVFFVRDAASSPYRQPWSWGGRDAADLARLDAADLVDPEASVRASPPLLPLLAEREQVYPLDTKARPDVRQAIEIPGGDGSPEQRERVDVIIFDSEEAEAWSENERRVFREGLERSGYERTFAMEGIEMYVEGGGNP